MVYVCEGIFVTPLDIMPQLKMSVTVTEAVSFITNILWKHVGMAKNLVQKYTKSEDAKGIWTLKI